MIGLSISTERQVDDRASVILRALVACRVSRLAMPVWPCGSAGLGRVPLRDIVGETTDVIEQLCIEAALELTSDNRASASEMLGLSRQSLYVKLRRYGLGDLGGDADQ